MRMLCFAITIAAMWVEGMRATSLKERIGTWMSNIAHCNVHDDRPLYLPSSDDIQKVVGLDEMPRIMRTTQATMTKGSARITEAPLIRSKLGSNKWSIVHEGIQRKKRDGDACPVDYQLCPASLNGGCCPADRRCGESECLPGSTAIQAACGKVGYAACGIEDGGGCCPTGYACGRTGCTASVGVIYSETCGINSYLCPASLNYGCCKTGMACGIANCYATDITTFTFTETIITTDSSSHTKTFTTTIISAATPTIPSPTSNSDAGAVPKINAPASSIPKTVASSTPSSGGLTRAQIGGIIAGAVAILLAVIVAACIIMRRLNKAIKLSDSSSRSRTRTSTSGADTNSRPKPAMVDVDAMSVDPLMMSPSEASEPIKPVKLPPRVSTTAVPSHEVDASPIFRSPFSPLSPASYQRYNPVASSDSQYSDSIGGGAGQRNGSVESTPPMSQIPREGGYFDIPLRPDHDISSPTSYVSPSSHQIRRPSQHHRNWSNASDQSTVSQTSSTMAELEASQAVDRKSSISRALHGMGLGRMASVRRSGSLGSSPPYHSRSSSFSKSQHAPLLKGGPARLGWESPNVMGGGSGGGVGGPGTGVPLGHIPEAGESRLGLGLSSGPDSGLAHEGSSGRDAERPVGGRVN